MFLIYFKIDIKLLVELSYLIYSLHLSRDGLQTFACIKHVLVNT
jgi:hypothetical protein